MSVYQYMPQIYVYMWHKYATNSFSKETINPFGGRTVGLCIVLLNKKL